MKSMLSFPVTATVRVVESGMHFHNENDHVIALGDAVKINTTLIDQYFCSHSTALAHDLMAVVGAVKFADRSITRQHAKAWGRSLSIEVPVYELECWSSTQVTQALVSCLNYLTGDEWRFQFKRRRTELRPIGQSSAPLALTEPHVFIPYSHGLDSYAQLRLLQERENSRVVCVYTNARGGDLSWQQLCRVNRQKEFNTIPIPASVRTRPHGEPSFRSRPFTYYLLAAYGAILHSDSRVLIPENGQGSLGGSLVTLGGEATHRSCHPGFTSRLAEFIYALTGKQVRFEHPALFKTKAEVLAELIAVEPDASVWLGQHWSCSHDHRHASVGAMRLHCGVCGNCMLRRVSIKGLALPFEERYKYQDLSAATLDGAIKNLHGPPRDIRAFEDLGRNSVTNMARLADLAGTPDDDLIWAESALLSRYLGQEATKTHGQLISLLKQHKKEWGDFLVAYEYGSWILKMVRGQHGN